MSEVALRAKPMVGVLPDKPGAVPGMIADQDSVRSTALSLYKTKGLPFIERILSSKKSSDRLKLDATKLLQQVALPPPQVHVGDVEVTIVVDL